MVISETIDGVLGVGVEEDMAYYKWESVKTDSYVLEGQKAFQEKVLLNLFGHKIVNEWHVVFKKRQFCLVFVLYFK